MKARDQRTKAQRKKRDVERKARTRWRDAVRKAKRSALANQRALLKAADEALQRALEDARDAYNVAVEDARLSFRAKLQDALVDERLAAEKANRSAQRRITAAAIRYERDVAHEEARLRRDLKAFPEAHQAQASHDRKVSDIRDACEDDKEALFREFSRRRRLQQSGRRKK